MIYNKSKNTFERVFEHKKTSPAKAELVSFEII
jgi:hypothetical protein